MSMFNFLLWSTAECLAAFLNRGGGNSFGDIGKGNKERIVSPGGGFNKKKCADSFRSNSKCRNYSLRGTFCFALQTYFHLKICKDGKFIPNNNNNWQNYRVGTTSAFNKNTKFTYPPEMLNLFAVCCIKIHAYPQRYPASRPTDIQTIYTRKHLNWFRAGCGRSVINADCA